MVSISPQMEAYRNSNFSDGYFLFAKSFSQIKASCHKGKINLKSNFPTVAVTIIFPFLHPKIKCSIKSIGYWFEVARMTANHKSYIVWTHVQYKEKVNFFKFIKCLSQKESYICYTAKGAAATFLIFWTPGKDDI